MRKRRKKFHVSPVLFCLLWILEIAVVTFGVYKIYTVNLIPDKFFVPSGILLVCLSGVIGILLLNGKVVHPLTLKRFFKRFTGTVLATALACGSLLTCDMAEKVSDTMTQMTEETSVSSKVGVYVLKKAKATELKDIKNFEFVGAKTEDTNKAIKKINKSLDSSIDLTRVQSPMDAIKELYNGSSSDTKAIILNEAYIDVVSEMDAYSNFEKLTKKVYEISIKKKKKVEKVNSDIVNNPFVMYLSGSDTRDEELTTSRSDVNILAIVNPKTKQLLLVNTPRDYYVANPAGGGALDKLTHCGLYGIDNSMQTLSLLYNESINYYMQINFTGFERVIDAVGGLDVDVEEGQEVETFYTDGSEGVQAGVNHLDGKRALAFARERYAYIDGDVQRGRNQMQVIQKFVQKVQTGEALKNYTEILESIQKMISTNLTSENISDLVKMQLQDGAEWTIQTYTVNGTGAHATTYSAGSEELYVTYPDDSMVQHASDLIDKVMRGEAISEEQLNGTVVESTDNGYTYEQEATAG